MKNGTPPRWDVSNVYPGLESQAFKAEFEQLQHGYEELDVYFKEQVAGLSSEAPVEALARVTGGLIERFNEVLLLSGTLRAYIYSFVATDSYDETAKRLLSRYEKLDLAFQRQWVRFQNFIGRIAPKLPEVLARGGVVEEHAFILREIAEQSRYLMSEAEETLAAELNLSGANAWGKLQGTLTSQLSVDFELDGKLRKLPMPALINLRSHPSEEVRRRAYETELEAWRSIEEPLAAAMNGVKGATSILNRRRGREDDLHSAIDEARIDRETLEVMLNAMEASFPMFWKYFKAKAARFSQKKLPWWNLFAPTGKLDTTYTFPQAQEFILDNFARFSPELVSFAQRAFDNHWIDAEQRSGKRGGGFCMSVPRVKESRILCNFDGSLDQVSTIAHELGHAFHNEMMYQAGKTELQRIIPMTLAETASIMCETIVIEAVMAQAANPAEELAILETALISDSQVIVDIYSRFLFEKDVFAQRAQNELSAAELCELMEAAQRATYGDGLDENYLHKYMWTWKPHYYRTDVSFYNFPYAFGLLFGIGLYAIYKQRGEDFIPDYKSLLANTGEGTAAELAAHFGIDIRQPEFWENSLRVIGERIERYTQIPVQVSA